MTRERLARLALLAYPEQVRMRTGIEMLGTALDASEHSNATFARELTGLAAGGLRARITTPVGLGTKHLIADGISYGMTAMIAVAFAQLISVAVAFSPVLATGRSQALLATLAVSLAAALIGWHRVAALAAVGAVAAIIDTPYLAINAKLFIATFTLPVACAAVMFITPRRRPSNPLRVAWLIPVAAFGIADGSGPDSYLVLAPILAAVPLAVVLLASDQRLAIACALCAAEFALVDIGRALQGGPIRIGVPLTVLLLAAAPLALAFTARRTRQLHPTDTV